MNTTTRQKLQAPEKIGLGAMIALFLLMCAALVVYTRRDYEQHLHACMQMQSEGTCRAYLG